MLRYRNEYRTFSLALRIVVFFFNFQQNNSHVVRLVLFAFVIVGLPGDNGVVFKMSPYAIPSLSQQLNILVSIYFVFG